MAVLKSKRKQSRLEVIHNYYKLRDAMTFKLFNNFGYREYHAERRISHKYFNNVPRHELSLPEQQIFAERLELSNKIFEEYIVAERKHLLQALRELGGKLPERDFDNLYRSWFKGHYKLMSKKQRQNLDELYKRIKEEKIWLTRLSCQTVLP